MKEVAGLDLDEEIRRLAMEFTGTEPERYEQALSDLCRRLKVSRTPSEAGTWISVGLALAREQREFAAKKRGRPANKPGRAIDYQRAMAVKALRREKESAGDTGPLADRTLIEELVQRRNRLFPRKEESDGLFSSVSRGNRIWREAYEEVKRLPRVVDRTKPSILRDYLVGRPVPTKR